MVGKYIIAATIFVLVIFSIGWADNECHKAGGVAVRTLFAYKCMRVQEIK